MFQDWLPNFKHAERQLHQPWLPYTYIAATAMCLWTQQIHAWPPDCSLWLTVVKAVGQFGSIVLVVFPGGPGWSSLLQPFQKLCRSQIPSLNPFLTKITGVEACVSFYWSLTHKGLVCIANEAFNVEVLFIDSSIHPSNHSCIHVFMYSMNTYWTSTKTRY